MSVAGITLPIQRMAIAFASRKPDQPQGVAGGACL